MFMAKPQLVFGPAVRPAPQAVGRGRADGPDVLTARMPREGGGGRELPAAVCDECPTGWRARMPGSPSAAALAPAATSRTGSASLHRRRRRGAVRTVGDSGTGTAATDLGRAGDASLVTLVACEPAWVARSASRSSPPEANRPAGSIARARAKNSS